MKSSGAYILPFFVLLIWQIDCFLRPTNFPHKKTCAHVPFGSGNANKPKNEPKRERRRQKKTVPNQAKKTWIIKKKKRRKRKQQQLRINGKKHANDAYLPLCFFFNVADATTNNPCHVNRQLNNNNRTIKNLENHDFHGKSGTPAASHDCHNKIGSFCGSAQ